MAGNKIHYIGKTGGNGISGFMGQAPVGDILVDNGAGYIDQDEFLTYDGAGTGSWVETQATSGTVEAGDAAGGIITMDAGASTADQGVQIQRAGESFLPAADKDIWFEARAEITNTSNQIFIGLAVEDTSIMATGENSTANHIGFEMNATTIAANPGILYFFSEKAGVRNTAVTAGTPTSGSFIKVGFHVYTSDGALVCDGYYDGARLGTQILAVNIPLTAMTPSFVCQAEGTTQPTLDVDWVKVVQLR